jgi:aspartyl-tRNA(Asn)/glutamyl-tRNA(Gln) amidotransferase subunit A
MILGKSLTQLSRMIKDKELSAKEVFDFFQKRVKKYNDKINVYLTENEFADNKAKNGKLSGLPIAFKDNFCTAGVRTTASSKVLNSFIPSYDATVVKNIQKAGGVVQGKTNMDAWAHGSSTETSDYGPSKNPWDISRAPGGSSGGSAAAVSAGLAPAAIGSETAGSIRQPSSWCGVIGLKPTYGRISRYGVIAMGSSFDCPGPMTTSVEDAALLLSVMAGKDKQDATSSPEKVDDYVDYLGTEKKYTIGLTDDYFEGVDNEVKEKVYTAIEVFKKMGHKFKNIKALSPKYSMAVYTILQRAEVSSNLARYDGIRYGSDRSFFGSEAKKRIMLGTYTLSHGYYDAYYKKAQKVRTLVIEDFQKIFKEVDFIMAPPTPMTALKLGEFEKYPCFGEIMDILNEPSAVAGIPAISVPCGFDSKDLPVGLQIMGNYFSEKDILNISHQFEKETNFFGVIEKGLSTYK